MNRGPQRLAGEPAETLEPQVSSAEPHLARAVSPTMRRDAVEDRHASFGSWAGKEGSAPGDAALGAEGAGSVKGTSRAANLHSPADDRPGPRPAGAPKRPTEPTTTVSGRADCRKRSKE